ncbi:MAG: FHA domain-containing protein [Chloroflexi bacterium]|nr:MAG: FHA domain-containing protein [Chloroflexota bacterium]
MTTDLTGQTLGNYRLDEVIGEGGMATVYKAFQLSLKRWVAVKVLHYQELTSVIRFQREAKAIAALRHRNILNIYEYGGEADGLPYIAMEYIEGGTLEDRLNGQPMDWKRVVELAIPIAKALHYAHQRGIIHRDVKPSNILMPQEDWPVLGDFGLVKYATEDQGLTRSGIFMGTPNYISPEQARGKPTDFKVDMYALGIIMFEMTTGVVPFDHENPNKVLLAHVMDPPPRPRDLNPDCPPALEAVILKALAKVPEDRYANMEELAEALRAVYDAPIPTVAREHLSAPTDHVTPKPASGITSFFKRLFGRKQSGKTDPPTGHTALAHQIEPLTDDDDSTIQLNLGSRASQNKPRLVLLHDDTTIELPNKASLIVGRTHGNSTADIDLEPHNASKLGVSRRHARLFRRGERWLLEDLNSLNGTFVNETEIKNGRPVTLNDGDQIRLSRMKLLFLTS